MGHPSRDPAAEEIVRAAREAAEAARRSADASLAAADAAELALINAMQVAGELGLPVPRRSPSERRRLT